MTKMYCVDCEMFDLFFGNEKQGAIIARFARLRAVPSVAILAGKRGGPAREIAFRIPGSLSMCV